MHNSLDLTEVNLGSQISVQSLQLLVYIETMKKIIESAERASSKLPYVLQESPIDPVVFVVVSPMLIGYTIVILIANLF